jgi:3-deoxy-7-phosphoheptulonate synthase
LPVIVDPSHGTGVRSFVTPMALAAAACGADGIIVEVHPNPKVALSDGQQSLFPEQFAKLMQQLKPILEVLGKELV